MEDFGIKPFSDHYIHPLHIYSILLNKQNFWCIDYIAKIHYLLCKEIKKLAMNL